AARPLLREADQRAAALAVAAEGALSRGKEPGQTEPLHPCAGDLLGIPGQEREARPTVAQLGERLGGAGPRLPAGRRVAREQLEVAGGHQRAPAFELGVDRLLVETGVVEDEPADVLRRLARMVDARDRVGGERHAVGLLE